MVLVYSEEYKTFIFKCHYSERAFPNKAGFKYDKASGMWITKDPFIAKKLRNYASDELKEKFKQHDRWIQKKLKESYKSTSVINIPSPEGLDYFPFQKAGIEFIHKKGNVLLADQTGTGKSIQAVGCINMLDDFEHILIICPNSLKLNWKYEIEKWLVHKDKKVVVNDTIDFKKADIMIVNYEAFRYSTNKKSPKYYKPKSGKHNSSEIILNKLKTIKLDYLILDESHRIKNYSSNTTRNIFKLRKYTKNKLLLSATPILNKPIDLWTSIKFLGYHEKFGRTKKNFGDKYCDPQYTPWGIKYDGATNLKELQIKLRQNFMIRRKKTDVLKDLPSKTRKYIPMEISDDYKEMITELDVSQIPINLDKNNPQESIFPTMKPDNLETIAELRQLSGKAKIQPISEYIQELLDNDEKVVIFGHHTEVLEAYYMKFKKKYDARLMIGKVPKEERNKNVNDFQNNPDTRVIINNFKVGGVGLTYTASSHVIMAEFDFVPANMSQAEDRLYRIGAKYPITAHYPVAEGTYDAYIGRMLIDKQDIIDKTIEKENI